MFAACTLFALHSSKSKTFAMQTIIVTAIICGAIGYAAYKLYRMLTDKPDKNGKCAGCTGCDLKKNVLYNCK